MLRRTERAAGALRPDTGRTALDVLLYSSEPLKADTEITGPVTVDLWASLSAPDTDFTAKLNVVKPDGEVINLNNGIVRTAFRDSPSSPQPADPGRPHEYRYASGRPAICCARVI